MTTCPENQKMCHCPTPQNTPKQTKKPPTKTTHTITIEIEWTNNNGCIIQNMYFGPTILKALGITRPKPEPPHIWRILEPGETTQPTDQIRHNNQWETHTTESDTVNHALIRRKHHLHPHTNS